MTRALLEHPRQTTLPFSMMFAVWFGYAWAVAWERSGGLMWVDVSVIWVLLAGYLTFTQFHVRATSFEMALPISTRRLWFTRMAGRGAATLLLVGIVVFSACMWSPSDGEILAAGSHVAATALLSVMLVCAAYPRRPSMPVDWRVPLMGIAITLGAIVLAKSLIGLATVYALAPLAAAMALGWWTYRSLPPTYELVPAAPRRARRAGKQRAAAPRSARWPVVGAVLRMLLAPEWCAVLLMLFAFAMMPGSEKFVPLVAIILPVLFLPVLQGLSQLAHLPVSRRLIFACGTLPALVVWIGGSLVGRSIWSSRQGFSLLVTFQPDGPSTLRWVHLGPEAALTAIVVVFCCLIWLAGLLIQMERGRKPASTPAGWRAQRFRKSLVLVLYSAVAIGGFAVILMSDEVFLWPILRRASTLSALLAIQKIVDWLPANPHLIATVTVVLGAAAYRAAEIRFASIEAPSKKQLEEY